MRYFVTALLVLALAVPVANAGKHYSRHYEYHNGPDFFNGNVSIEFDDGSIIIYEEEYEEEVEITATYELFIDGDKVDLNAAQTELVEEFYVQSMDVVDYAKEIGWEGAKIGVEGVKLGLKAVGKVFKLLLADYDSDDLEREMEREAEIIEAKAEILEDKAEMIEELVDELEEICEEMREDIPELDELGWF